MPFHLHKDSALTSIHPSLISTAVEINLNPDPTPKLNTIHTVVLNLTLNPKIALLCLESRLWAT